MLSLFRPYQIKNLTEKRSAEMLKLKAYGVVECTKFLFLLKKERTFDVECTDSIRKFNLFDAVEDIRTSSLGLLTLHNSRINPSSFPKD